ncbi:hypothetical protein [Nonomuraea sp. NPDC003709]|uniref:hypothetical protein n=1 Tax=Nonomuraea sp. NPDC003709 TaxID=3154450 RepID=UPI0033A8B923
MPRAATLVATVRELEGSSVDDALLLFDLLMSTKLLSGAVRKSDKEKLKTFPRLKTAAARMAAAWAVVLRERPGDEAVPASVPELMAAVEQLVSRADLAAAVEPVRALLPPAEDDDDGEAEWRAALLDRYATVRPVIELLAAPPPEGFTAVHDAVAAMLPRIDYPELLLEVNARTGFLDAMPHLSGSQAPGERIWISLYILDAIHRLDAAEHPERCQRTTGEKAPGPGSLIFGLRPARRIPW